MPITALYDNVVLRRIEASTTTASGLIVPVSATASDQWLGEVVAHGPGKLLQDGSISPLTVKVGDKVIISTKSEYRPPINVDGEELHAFKENELVGIVI